MYGYSIRVIHGDYGTTGDNNIIRVPVYRLWSRTYILKYIHIV